MKLNNNKKSVKISRSLFMLYAVMVCGMVFALPAFAADDPLVVVENLSQFVCAVRRHGVRHCFCPARLCRR